MLCALELADRRTCPCTVAADGKCHIRPLRRLVSHGKIGMGFRIADQKVEEHRAADDRYRHRPYGKSDSVFCKSIHDAAVGFKAKGRTAGKDHGVDLLHRFLRREKIRLPRPRCAAAYIDSRGRTPFRRQNDGHARKTHTVLRRADTKSRNRYGTCDHGNSPFGFRGTSDW